MMPHGELNMPKNEMKPCNLTEDEWDFLHQVFDQYCEDCDSSEEARDTLKEIHMKVFFMNELVKEME